MTELAENYAWYYGFGTDPERYHGGYATRAEAVAEGFAASTGEGAVITVLEGRHGAIDAAIFDEDRLMDDLCDHNAEVADEDDDLGLDQRTPKQSVELEQRLTRVLGDWLTEHKLGRVRALADTRNVVVLTVPPDQEGTATT